MLRLWTCWFQGAGRASRWRFLAVSWKYHCTWQIAALGYRNERSRSFLKSLNCGLTGIILFLRGKTLRSIRLWRIDHREEGKERIEEEGAWRLENASLASKRPGSTRHSFCGRSFTSSSSQQDFFLLLCLTKSLPSLPIPCLILFC